MEFMKVLLIGTYEQSDYKKWRYADIISAYNPYTEIGEPQWNCSAEGIIFVVPNYDKLNTLLVCKALETGKPVCIMKVRVSKEDDLKQICSLPSKLRENLYIGEQYRYIPGMLTLIKAIQNEMIGKMEFISWQTSLDYTHAEWMDAYSHMIFEDLSYHHFTALTSLTGELHGKVSAFSFTPTWMKDKGFASMLFEGDDGLRINYNMRWGSALKINNFLGKIILEGEKGVLMTDGSKVIFYPRNGEEKLLPIENSPYSDWAGTIDHFCCHIAGEDNGEGGKILRFDDYYSSARLMYAAVRASENKSIEII